MAPRSSLLRAAASLSLAYLALSSVRSFVGGGDVSPRGSALRARGGEEVEVIDVPAKTPTTEETQVIKRAKTEVLPLLADRGVGNRKLRAAIESIELDQEALRMSSPLLSMKTLIFSGSAAAVSGLATLVLASPSLFILAPSLTTVIFLYSSLSESAAARYKAKAKFNYGQNSKIASTAESSLATAEARKVFFPFGVGLTAITAAACVTLRIFNEKIGDFIPESNEAYSTLLAGDNFLMIFFALTSVVGATLTSLTYISTKAALFMDESRQLTAKSDWDAQQLPKTAREPSKAEERNVVLATILFCILPLPFIVESLDFSLWDSNREGFNKALQEFLDDASVAISASAAAQAAVAFLLGERDFTEAEQRCAMQSKQAALAEMFCAQAQQEAAIIPVRSAFAAFARGGADLAIEFSRAAVALFPWGAVGQAFQALLNSQLVMTESNAATSEARIVKYGPKRQRNRNPIDSSLIELTRIQKEVFPPNNEIKQEISSLRPGEMKEFRINSKEGRREVHLIAAEMNMFSQSFTSGNQRVVSVRNTGQVNKDALVEEERSLPEVIEKEFWTPLGKEVEASFAEGIPAEWSPWVTGATVAAAASQGAPVVLGPDASQVVLPLVTGGIGLLTVWQERAGREQVAYAKKDAALLLRQHAEAEALVGLAALSASILPTYIAVSAVASALSCVGFLADFGVVAWAFEVPTLAISAVTYLLSLERQEQVEKYIVGATRIVGGKAPRKARFQPQKIWVLLPILVMLLPETLIRRCCAANALLVAELGFVLANCARYVAFGEFYTARTRRVHSRTAAWAQIASACSRVLPLTSALALSNTLLVTSLGAVNVSFGGLFPIFGLGVCVKAIQRAVESRESAIITQQEGRDCQRLGDNFPPYPELKTEEDLQSDMVQRLRLRNDVMRTLKPKNMKTALLQLGRGLVRLFNDSKPEESFNSKPEDKVIQRVQADLEELRITVRGNDPNWVRIGSIVALLTGASVLAPFLLSELLTEVIVPLAGTVLTVFVVTVESQSRSSVAQAKTHAAQINEQMSAMEELVSISSLWKAYLFGMVGIADCNAILSLVLKHPWSLIETYSHLGRVQELAQLLVAGSSILLCGLAAGRLLQVREWANCVEKIAADNFNQKMLSGITQTSPMSVDRGAGSIRTARRKRILTVAASLLPPLALLIFPWGGELAEKAVNSAGASALVVAMVLLQAERASCQAERTQASCKRAASLCEAFAERAEQQGALLPFNSAVAIALAGVITFLTELNPVTAAALTIFQALSWLVASRKGVATKFESLAALQVRSRLPPLRNLAVATGSFGQRLKRLLIG